MLVINAMGVTATERCMWFWNMGEGGPDHWKGPSVPAVRFAGKEDAWHM